MRQPVDDMEQVFFLEIEQTQDHPERHVGGDGDPDRYNVQMQHQAKQEDQRDADAPDANGSDVHGHPLASCRPDRAAIDLGHDLRYLDKSDDEHIERADFAQISLVGQKRHQLVRQQQQQSGGKKRHDERDARQLAVIGLVKATVFLPDRLGNQRGRRGDESKGGHIGKRFRLKTKLVRRIAIGAVCEDHLAHDDGAKLPKHVFTARGKPRAIDRTQTLAI